MDTFDEVNMPEASPGKWLKQFFSGNGFLQALFSLLEMENDEPSHHISPFPNNGGVLYELKRAREALKMLQETGSISLPASQTSGIISFEPGASGKGLEKFLQESGIDAAQLDPNGKKSTAEMNAIVRDAPRLGYIAQAKQFFKTLTSPDTFVTPSQSDDPVAIAREVENRIAKANEVSLVNGGKGVDFSALDPTGNKSSSQMQNELHAAIVQGYIARARDELEALQNSASHYALESDNKTWDLLAKADTAAKQFGLKPVDASALDPEGKQSALAMNQKVLRAIRDEHFQQASEILYWSQHGGYGDPNKGAKDLQEQLEVVNRAGAAMGDRPVNVAQLDVNGGKYHVFNEQGIQKMFRELGKPSFYESSAEKEEDRRMRHYSHQAVPLDTPLAIPASVVRQKD